MFVLVLRTRLPKAVDVRSDLQNSDDSAVIDDQDMSGLVNLNDYIFGT